MKLRRGLVSTWAKFCRQEGFTEVSWMLYFHAQFHHKLAMILMETVSKIPCQVVNHKLAVKSTSKNPHQYHGTESKL